MKGLARRFVEECRRRQVILPGLSVMERLCADALVAAERRIEARIVAGLDDDLRLDLDRLLTEEVDGSVSRLVWLRRFEVGRNSADINSLLDRLEFLQASIYPPICWRPFLRIALPVFAARESATSPRGYATFRVIAVSPSSPSVPWSGAALSPMPWSRPMTGSWGQTFRSAKRRCDERLQDSRAVLHDILDSFKALGVALLEAKGDGAPLEKAVAAAGGWQKLEGVVAAAEQLNDTMSADPLAHVFRAGLGSGAMRPACCARWISRLPAPANHPCRVAGYRTGSQDMPRTFLRRNSRWHQHLNARPAGDRRLWEVATLFHMRDAFRSGDVWLAHPRRYGDVKQALVPIEAAHATARLAVPLEPRGVGGRTQGALVEGLERLADAAQHGTIPGGAIENGELRISRPANAMPEDVDELVLDLYRRLPEARITDILLEVTPPPVSPTPSPTCAPGAMPGPDRTAQRPPRRGPQSGAQQDGRGLQHP